MHHGAISFALIAGLLTGCQTLSTSHANSTTAEAAVRAALDQQVREWNAGNLAGFMETYARSEQTRFASGGNVSLGWQTVFDRYQKNYGTRAAMGTLSFSDVEITPLGPDAALAFGHWHLRRGTDVSSGLFSLIFRKTVAGWRITHDHTSTVAKE